MYIIVAYDVNVTSNGGEKRLRKVAKECVNYGQRVQNSLFEINLDYGNFIILKNKLEKIIDKKLDSIRFYYLGNKWERKIETLGVDNTYNSEGLLII